MNPNDTPKGVHPLLYQETALFEKVEIALLDHFALWGFTRAITPAIEYRDSLIQGMDDASRRQVITFVDQAAQGRPLALRSDVTPQIARMAASTLAGRPLPLKLSYAETVYRSAPQGQGARMELHQAGVELIGVSSPEADAELIAMAVESLELLGFDEVALSIGHVGYLRGLIEALELPPEGAEKVEEALMKKDAHGLPLALDAAGAKASPAREALETLAHRFGGLEQIEKAPSLCEACAGPLAELARLHEALRRYGVADKVTLDLTEARGFGYYTGVTFEGFVKGIAWPVLTGGRYDKLVGLYSRDLPGAGFAVDAGRIVDYYSEAETDHHWAGADILVVAAEGSSLDAASMAKALRDEGLAASRDLILRPVEESLELAKRMNIPLVVITGLADAPEPGMVKLIDLHGGEERFAHPTECIELIEPTE